jgi:hypothetical protein
VLNNAIVTLSRRGVGIDQTTGRRAAETAVVYLQDAPCLVGQSKSNRITYSDGLREIVKPAYALSLETYEQITIAPGDQAEVTMRDGVPELWTVADAIPSIGIRRKIWNMTIERIKTAAPNE